MGDDALASLEVRPKPSFPSFARTLIKILKRI
jgi:hypothetical protein